MAQFSVHDAKTNLSRLIADVLAGGEVVIARGNVPADYGDTLLNPQICKLPNFSEREHVMGQQNPSAKTRLALIMATALLALSQAVNAAPPPQGR